MRWIDRLAARCALLAGYALFLVMALVVLGVVFRYVLGKPIFGSQDAMEMMLIGVAILGMAHCARTGGHIAVDLFERALGRGGRFVGDVVSTLLGVGLLLVLVWGAVQKMLDAWEWGDATNLLQIPFWPFYGLIAFGALLYALAYLPKAGKAAGDAQDVQDAGAGR